MPFLSFFEHEVLFIIELELSTTVLGEQDAVALAHINGGTIAIVKQAAGADSNHSTLLGFLLGSVGNDDATLGNFFFGGCFDDHAVADRTNLCHVVCSSFYLISIEIMDHA